MSRGYRSGYMSGGVRPAVPPRERATLRTLLCGDSDRRGMKPFWADRGRVARVGALILTSTVVLTASFIGVVAVVTGGVVDFERRLPAYVLVTAAVFVSVIVLLDDETAAGSQVLAVTVSIGVVTFLVAALGGEGVVFALEHPAELVSSQLVFYFLSAGLLCTGVGYWAIHHWREYTDPRNRTNLRR